MTTTAATPAQAADTVTCAPSASVFASDSAGALWLYKLNSPATSAAAWSPKVKVGSGGWQNYGRILGGPDGRVYGINAEGVRRYRYNGSGWDTVEGSQSQLITPGMSQYATTAYRDKITIDERGNFYLIDGTGRLRWYQYDEATKTWPVWARVLGTGWDQYNLIVASTVGTLLARKPDGSLFRYRYDPVSQRWLERAKLVGSSWNTFSKGILSVGGDTAFGIKSTGEILQYRYREDTGAWPVAGRQIGTGWQTFLNVTATTNACTLSVDHSPARPSLSFAANTPVSSVQASPSGGAALGDLYYSFTNTIGQLVTGRQSPDNASSLVWTTEPGNDAFTARPTLLDDGNGTVTALAQNINSDLWLRSQSTPGGVTWGPWLNLAGAMITTPTAVRLSDKSLAVFGTSSDGSVWSRTPDGTAGDLLPWTPLGGTGLTGALTAVAVADRTVVLLATDASGTVIGARFRDGALTSPWTSLGGTGFVGTPTAVLLPGYFLRIFVRTADGHVVTQVQDPAGAAPGTWQPVGDDTYAGSGTPSAVLNPQTGRLMVFSRTGDAVYFVDETGQGTATWGTWQIATNLNAPAASDPVALIFRESGGVVVSFIVRNPAGNATVWRLSNDGAGLAARKSTFREQVLPAVAR